MSPAAKAQRPTAHESRSLDAYAERTELSSRAPRFKVERNKEGCITISPDHEDACAATVLVMEAVGADDVEFYRGLLDDLARLATVDGEVSEDKLNFLISAVKGMQPRDQTEAMLAAQMAAIHSATMQTAHRLHAADALQLHDSMEKALNKLARTFASQVEALRKYRTGGEQRVTVQHVNVNEGGQAIVGDVCTGGGGRSKKQRGTP